MSDTAAAGHVQHREPGAHQSDTPNRAVGHHDHMPLWTQIQSRRVRRQHNPENDYIENLSMRLYSAPPPH